MPKGMKLVSVEHIEGEALPTSFKYIEEDADELLTFIGGRYQMTPYGVKKEILADMKRNGIFDLRERENYTFDTYIAKEAWQKEVLRIAKQYVDTFKESWFCITGITGSGKTHIATSIVFGLASKGIRVEYVSWSDFIASVKEDLRESGSKVEYMKRVSVLYMDDFLKTGNNEEPSKYDLGVAWQIISARDRSGLVTILSSEYDVETTMSRYNNALTGRISYNAGEYLVPLGEDEKRNYRNYNDRKQ